MLDRPHADAILRSVRARPPTSAHLRAGPPGGVGGAGPAGGTPRTAPRREAGDGEHEVDRLLRDLGRSQSATSLEGAAPGSTPLSATTPETERITLLQGSDGRAEVRIPEVRIPVAPPSDADATLVNLRALRADRSDADMTGALTAAVESLSRTAGPVSLPDGSGGFTTVRPMVPPAPPTEPDLLDQARTAQWSGARIQDRVLALEDDTEGTVPLTAVRPRDLAELLPGGEPAAARTAAPPAALPYAASPYASPFGASSNRSSAGAHDGPTRSAPFRNMLGSEVRRGSGPSAAGWKALALGAVAGGIVAALLLTPAGARVRESLARATDGSPAPKAAAGAARTEAPSSEAEGDLDDGDELEPSGGIPTVAVGDLPRARRKKAKKKREGGEESRKAEPEKARGEAAREAAREVEARPAAAGESGLLTVVCYPACDEVLLDGQALGPSPVFKHPVAFGSHSLVLKTTDPAVSRPVEVSVQGTEPVVVRQSMAP